MYNAPEELLDRLALPDVSADTVLEYLWAQHDELMRDYEGPAAPSPSDFFNGEADLASYRAARAWWPRQTDLPAPLGFPSVYQLCWSYHEGPTFAERLTAKSMPVVKWLEANGLSVQAPNETAEERKLRQNRESQARFRARKAGTADAGQAQAIADAYARYMAACAERKAAYDAASVKVRETRQEWEALKTGSASPE